MDAVATVTCSLYISKQNANIRNQVHAPQKCQLSRSTLHFGRSQPTHHCRLPLYCSKLFSWETSSSTFLPTEDGGGIVKGRGPVEPIDVEDKLEYVSPDQEREDVIDLKKPPLDHKETIKWPMWFLGPSVILVTGIVPTLWLPLSSVIQGPTIAGLLSLLGLDCVFNIGATLFLLMSDACGRRPRERGRVGLIRNEAPPLIYKLWNIGSSIFGFLAPCAMLLASHRGALHPQLEFIQFWVLLGPYLLLLSVQVVTEMLTWHWRSPVWLAAPVVYGGYRVLQLMRGLSLGEEIGAPAWALFGMRWLVSWCVFVLGVQLMRVAWFAGHRDGDSI